MVYLLKRKSDSKLYVGITSKRRLKTRMADHKRSRRFFGDDFEMTILAESTDRAHIEALETEYVQHYNTHEEGLNSSAGGKGHGHNSPRFTTLGYIYSEESRQKMSKKAKLRSKRDKDKMIKRSEDLWKDPEYRKSQEGKRKGKRLRPPVLSDDQVSEIRKLFESEREKLNAIVETINAERKKKGYFTTTVETHFANMHCSTYGVSKTLIRNIVTNKGRTECLPAIYKS